MPLQLQTLVPSASGVASGGFGTEGAFTGVEERAIRCRETRNTHAR
ncbi:MAG: hypothetical protein ACTHW5_06340 [Microbacterium sp.]